MNMSNVLEMTMVGSGIWDESSTITQIQEIYGRGLSDGEFNTFIQIGKATGLNPFLKELWAVKYGNTAAQIFIGRDGYRKSAQTNPLYDYHLVDAVYANDDFSMSNGEVCHKYNLADRGQLVGAYCVVKRKNAEKPMFTFVELKEYTTNRSLWNKESGKPATMIKKVAEAQGLRMAFQALFAGTYHEYENWQDHSPQIKQPPAKGVMGLKSRLGLLAPSVDDVLTKIKEAESLDQLKLAAQLAQDFSEENKKVLRNIYMQKQQNFKDNRSNLNV